MKSIAVTGYFATGSGAVYNLLQEYCSVDDGGLSAYEHLFLYDVNGVFETIDRILYNNSLYNSNAAINAFRREMQRLNNIDFGWFGGYRYMCENQFMDIIEEFITEITQYRIDREWYGIYEDRKLKAGRIVRDAASIMLGRRKLTRNFGTAIELSRGNRGEFSFADETTLKEATKKLVSKYLNIMYPETDKTIILNHMLSPQDAHRVPGYMPEDMKLIIVDRDIRDLYVYNKYTKIWGDSTFPTDLDDFIRFTKSYRATERPVESDRILRIRFEDLIYHYDQTVEKIEAFAQLSPDDHIAKKTKLVPERSIKNTQVYRMNSAWAEEIRGIEQELPEYVYPFPYHSDTSASDLFDA